MIEGAAEAEFSSGATASDLTTVVESAGQLPEGPQRDAALLAALRMCRRKLEAAEAEAAETQTRLSEAKDTFNIAAELLSGTSPSSVWESLGEDGSTAAVGANSTNAKNGKRGGRGGLPFATDHYLDSKRHKTASRIPSVDNTFESTTYAQVPVPTNPLHIPATHNLLETGDALMTAEMVAEHRESFYQKLLGMSATEVENYVPSLSQANLRSKSQLAEGIHVARHWETGADGLDATAFRVKQKNWYTKMKPRNNKMGRRTGIHVRTVTPPHGREGEGEAVLCRHNKDGTKSLVYLDLTQLYDALFEVHCLEYGHLRGKEVVKAHVDELYANVPESQVKIFVDTCPVNMEKRRIQLGKYK